MAPGKQGAHSGHVFGRGPGLPACKPGARPHHPLLRSLPCGLFFGTFIERHLLCFPGAQSFPGVCV